MTGKIEELLSVLDKSEKEQIHWLINNQILKLSTEIESESLADLAFRMRDEAGDRFIEGIEEIFEHLYDYSDYKSLYYWICSKECKPIHIIIAALITK